jgi:hypothetical protein
LQSRSRYNFFLHTACEKIRYRICKRKRTKKSRFNPIGKTIWQKRKQENRQEEKLKEQLQKEENAKLLAND